MAQQTTCDRCKHVIEPRADGRFAGFEVQGLVWRHGWRSRAGGEEADVAASEGLDFCTVGCLRDWLDDR